MKFYPQITKNGVSNERKKKMLKDEEVAKYINETVTEQLIRNSEDDLLSILKYRQEKLPSEKNNKEWLDYTNLICARRYQSIANEDKK